MTEELFIKMVLDNWFIYVKRTDDLFNELSDEQIMKQIAPGRNRGIYLLGHLAAVHDRMLPLLEFEQNPLHPELDGPFHINPDDPKAKMPDISTLKGYWKEINETLAKHFQKLKPADWFQKHTAVSEEDFKKEPYRNKLNVMINRAGHLAGHYGQLLLLKVKPA